MANTGFGESLITGAPPDLKIHELSAVFPDASTGEYALLVDGMREDGYDPNFPIVLYGGKILDGRHRYQAAGEVGLLADVTMRDYVGEYAEARKFVIHANAARRSMSSGQLICYAAAIADSPTKGGRPGNCNEGYSIARAAKDVGVSRKAVSQMRTALDYDKANGTDFFARAWRGEISPSAAYGDMRRLQKLLERNLAEARETEPRGELRAMVNALDDVRIALADLHRMESLPSQEALDKGQAALKRAEREFDRIEADLPDVVLEAALEIFKRRDIGIMASIGARRAERVIARYDESKKRAN